MLIQDTFRVSPGFILSLVNADFREGLIGLREASLGIDVAQSCMNQKSRTRQAQSVLSPEVPGHACPEVAQHRHRSW
jgi:hypothetical protein